MDGIAGDQRALGRQGREQRPGGGDLVPALGPDAAAEADPRPGPEGGHHREGRAPGRAVEGAPERLAVDGQHPRAVGAEVGQERLEGPAARGRIERPEHPAERAVARQRLCCTNRLMAEVPLSPDRPIPRPL